MGLRKGKISVVFSGYRDEGYILTFPVLKDMMQFYKSRSKSINRFLFFAAMWLYVFWIMYKQDAALRQPEASVANGEAVVFSVFLALIISAVYLLGMIILFFRVADRRLYYGCLIALTLIPVVIVLSRLHISL